MLNSISSVSQIKTDEFPSFLITPTSQVLRSKILHFFKPWNLDSSLQLIGEFSRWRPRSDEVYLKSLVTLYLNFLRVNHTFWETQRTNPDNETLVD